MEIFHKYNINLKDNNNINFKDILEKVLSNS